MDAEQLFLHEAHAPDGMVFKQNVVVGGVARHEENEPPASGFASSN